MSDDKEFWRNECIKLHKAITSITRTNRSEPSFINSENLIILNNAVGNLEISVKYRFDSSHDDIFTKHLKSNI